MLAFFFLLHTSSSWAESIDGSETVSLQKAGYYQQIIMRDVPNCKWDETTKISHITPLYDPKGCINGYIYEYTNNEQPAGFIQIDISSGIPKLDSYTFEDEHYAAREMRNLSLSFTNVQNKTNRKLVHLGAYSYLLMEETNNKQVKVYDLFSHEQLRGSLQKLQMLYTDRITQKNEIISQQNTQYKLQQVSTITKIVSNYQSKRLATYNNCDNTGVDCQALAETNICMYWAQDRGKTKLVQTMHSTFDALYTDMNITSNGMTGGTSSQTHTAAFHMLVMQPAVLGYQYIGVENTLILADGYQSGLVYRTYASCADSDGNFLVNDGAFAYYLGW